MTFSFRGVVISFSDNGENLSSLGITNNSTIFIVLKAATGNTERDQLLSLARMTRSLSNLRGAIRSLPNVVTVDSIERFT